MVNGYGYSSVAVYIVLAIIVVKILFEYTKHLIFL